MADAQYTVVTIRYRQYDRRWTEVIANQATTFGTIIPGLVQLVPASLACRHPSVYISSVRLSNPALPRQTQVIHIANPANPVGAVIPAVTSTAAIYEFKGALDGVNRRIWIRGLRDDNVDRRPGTGQDIVAGSLDAQVKAYFDLLRTQNYGIASLVPVDGAVNKRVPITSITVDDLGRVALNTDIVFTLSDRKRVVLYQINQKQFPGLKGRFSVNDTPTSIKPLGYLTPMAPGVYPVAKGAWRNAEYRFTGFLQNGATFLAFDRRDTKGGPLDTAGRQRSLILRSR